MAVERVVLKVGGNVLLDAAQVKAIAAEVAALRAAGRAVAVVHGGGPQLDAALAALGEPVRKVDGLRVTSPRAAAVVAEVLDVIGASLASALASAGVPSRHHAATMRLLQASPKEAAGGTLQRVGGAPRFRAAALEGAAAVAVVTPVGWDAEGPLNVNADEGAAAVAAAWKAHWLILATDVAGVRDGAGQALSRLTPPEARRLVAEKAATGGMIPKLDAALAALASGVPRVLIAQVRPGALTGAVLEGRPEGTLVQARLEAQR